MQSDEPPEPPEPPEGAGLGMSRCDPRNRS